MENMMNQRTMIIAGLCLMGVFWTGCGAARQKPHPASAVEGRPGDLDQEICQLAARCEDLVMAEIRRLASKPRRPIAVETETETETGGQIEFDASLLADEPISWTNLAYWLEHDGEIGEVCSGAFRGYETLLAEHPTSDGRDRAAFELAVLRMSLSPTEESAAHLAEIARETSRADLRMESLVRLGAWYFGRGEMGEASRCYLDVLDATGSAVTGAGAGTAEREADLADQARYLLAWVYIEADGSRALALMTEVATGARDEAFRRQALLDLAHLYADHGDPDQAVTFALGATDDPATRIAFLDRLSGRLSMKQRYEDAQPIFDGLLAQVEGVDRCPYLFDAALCRWEAADHESARSALDELQQCIDAGEIDDDYVHAQVRRLQESWDTAGP